jgi:hypothetical protein
MSLMKKPAANILAAGFFARKPKANVDLDERQINAEFSLGSMQTL